MKTLWFRDTYIALLIVSYKNPRVIPMLYSFYLIVYLICISYFIIIFPFYVLLFFCMWVIYRIFLLSLILWGSVFIYFMFVFLVIMIGIILSLALCDNGLSLTYDNPFFIFYVFVLGYGYIILVIWGIIELFIS